MTTTFTGGNHALAQWEAPSDLAQCPRCGIWRTVRTGRDNSPCQDCRTVETLARRQQSDAPVGRSWTYRGVTTWATPMSAEDRQWCERQVDKAFWGQWEKFNRSDENPLQTEAERRARRLCTHRPELSTLADGFSTRSGDSSLGESCERMFDSEEPKGAA